MSMEISERDKQLFYIVGAIAILALAFFFGYKNFNDKKESYEAQTKKYNDEYAELLVHQKQRDDYLRLTDEFLEVKEQILEQYADGYNQEYFIKTISDLEDKDSVWVSEIEFSEPFVMYEFASEPGREGVSNTNVMNVICDYDGLKAFLASTLSMNSKTVIDEVSMEFDEEVQVFDLEMVLTHYSTQTPETVGPEAVIDLPVGVKNIFDSSAVTSNTQTQGSKGSYILTDYDFSVIISQDKAANDSIIVGTTNDEKAKDSISSDENKRTDLTITIDGSDGKYTVSYQLGDEKYPSKNFEKGVTFKPGATLDLLVLSSPRADKNDKVAVDATIVNNSDMKLNVLVSGDDTDSPRFKATKDGSNKENIVIYR